MKKNKPALLKASGLIVLSLTLLSSCLLNSNDNRQAGNGVTIGNPVQGYINNPDGTPAKGAMVVYGVARENEIDTVFTSGPNWRVIEVQYKRNLDSVKTESDGYFVTDKLPSADYVIMAHKDKLSFYHRFFHNANDVSDLNYLTLGESHSITVAMGDIVGTKGEYRFIQIQNGNGTDLEKSPGLVYPSSEPNFSGAYIKGTNLEGKVESSYRTIEGAPTADFDMVVHDLDSNRYELPFNNDGNNCVLYVLHEEKVAKWTNGCVSEDPEKAPSLLWSLPPDNAVGAKARIRQGKQVMVTLKFSHPMEENPESDMVSVISPENVKVKSAVWNSYDLVELELCKTNGNVCDSLSNFEVATDYKLEVSKNISSFFGVQKIELDTITFTPEPVPRVKTVTGFGSSRDASYYDNDMILDEVILDVDIFPSVASAEGNMLFLSTVGMADAGSLEDGIHCLRDEEDYPCLKSANEDGIFIEFENDLTAPNSYKLILDTNLTFNGGISYPKSQTISWNTVFFTRKIGVE